MDRKPVSSSNIRSIGHNESTGTMEVEFLNGSIYQYYDVPERVYQMLIDAPSVGSAFNSIKAEYSFARIS